MWRVLTRVQQRHTTPIGAHVKALFFMAKISQTHKRNRIRHEFLLTFFNPEDKYSIKQVNGYHLVKQKNMGGEWEVAIFTKEAFDNREKFLKGDS